MSKDYKGGVFGGLKYFWGNMPAIDILQLRANEGETYSQPVDLLFAASGDLRNVIKTINSLPITYNQPVSVAINDQDFDIVARNLLLLLAASAFPDKGFAVDWMLHMWYSSMLRPQDMVILSSWRSLIENTLRGITANEKAELRGKIWEVPFAFGVSTIRVGLTKEMWTSFLSYLEAPAGMTKDDARRLRIAVTLAREDTNDRISICQRPGHRLCGWDWAEVLAADGGLATNDIYGKLFTYVKDVLGKFWDTLRSRTIDFKLINVDALTIGQYFPQNKFARIETSNIADDGYLGATQTLLHVTSLLKSPAENPHATVLLLFMNAVEDTISQEEELKIMPAEVKRVLKFMPLDMQDSAATARYGKENVLRSYAAVNVRDGTKYFEQYMRARNFTKTAEVLKMSPKIDHTIVEKWPLKLKLLPHQQGAKEEFMTLLLSPHQGIERYMEWQRTA
ncbi:hypothetical protein LTR10_001157 [Elasticomyces elasticus]|nr:hypothetical protein LTR10_001157 [Elasticomyces elasticus]KAK4965477.1 hypothetical protein LTR42_012233 [Elasticomyces elasticus]